MAALSHIRHWGDRHHPAFLNVLRIALGLFLLYRGVAYMQNQAYLNWILETQAHVRLNPPVIHFVMAYVTYVQMTGGLLIALGLLTRTASVLQLPIVAGAIFFINVFKSPVNTELWYSVFALVLLLLFTVLGSGPFSLNAFLEKITPHDER